MVQRVLFVVALLMLALPRLGVHAPRFGALEDRVQASTRQLSEAQRGFDALPLLQPCLDSLGSDTAAETTQAACAPYQQAAE